MKNSKIYATKIQKLYRSLKRKTAKADPIFYDEPAEAAVYAVLAEHLTEPAARTAYKKCRDYFVDFNEARVSRAEEINNVIGGAGRQNLKIATEMINVLGAIFTGYHKISLESLKKIGKRPAKQTLEKLPGFSRFIIDYCMLTAFQGHAIPLTETMVEFLSVEGLVHPSAVAADIEGFLTKQISAKDGYEFYMLLRLHAETTKPKKKKAAKTKTAKKPKETAKKEDAAKKKPRKQIKKK